IHFSDAAILCPRTRPPYIQTNVNLEIISGVYDSLLRASYTRPHSLLPYQYQIGLDAPAIRRLQDLLDEQVFGKNTRLGQGLRRGKIISCPKLSWLERLLHTRSLIFQSLHS